MSFLVRPLPTQQPKKLCCHRTVAYDISRAYTCAT